MMNALTDGSIKVDVSQLGEMPNLIEYDFKSEVHYIIGKHCMVEKTAHFKREYCAQC